MSCLRKEILASKELSESYKRYFEGQLDWCVLGGVFFFFRALVTLPWRVDAGNHVFVQHECHKGLELFSISDIAFHE